MSQTTPQAKTTDTSDWRTRIHALNVLRLLLLDAGPSREASRAYMAPAMAVVLQVRVIDDVDGCVVLYACLTHLLTSKTINTQQGFRDTRWAVRNSALMVFGALVNAAVGSGKNALGSTGSSGSSGGSGPTAQSRYDSVR